MKKRYAITLDEEVALQLRVEAARENVTVGEIIGRRFTVDEVKKAIEPDKVKQAPRGRLTKGLGDVPGVSGVTHATEQLGITGKPWDKDYSRPFTPAPKPGKK